MLFLENNLLYQYNMLFSLNYTLENTEKKIMFTLMFTECLIKLLHTLLQNTFPQFNNKTLLTDYTYLMKNTSITFYNQSTKMIELKNYLKFVVANQKVLYTKMELNQLKFYTDQFTTVKMMQYIKLKLLILSMISQVMMQNTLISKNNYQFHNQLIWQLHTYTNT